MSVITCQEWKQGGRASEGWSGYGVSVLTTGWTGAKEGVHPKVSWACVKDNLEFLWGCSNGDVTDVEQLQGEGGNGLVQNCLPSIPTLMPPSGCHILLRSLSNHRATHRLWSQIYLHLIYFSYATLYVGYWLYDQALNWYLLHGKPRGVTTGPPWPWNTQGSPGSFIWQALLSLQTQPQHPLLQEVLLDQPQPLPLNSDHIQSTPHKWSFHLTCIYSLPISQAGMGIPEDK